MKKHILLASILLCFTGISKAQKIKYGAKAGINLSTFSGEIKGKEYKTGFYGGIYSNLKIKDKLSFQPEILFSKQGLKVNYHKNISSGLSLEKIDLSEEYNTSYILVPMMLNYEFVEGFNFEFGPQVGFILSSKWKYNKYDLKIIRSYPNGLIGIFQELESKVEAEEDIKEYSNFLDLGVNFGLKYELKNGINFGIRYNLGLSNILKNESSNYSGYKNSVISAGIGYTFNK